MAYLTFQKPDTDSIEGIIIKYTYLSIHILTHDLEHVWLPKSLIHNYYEPYNTYDHQKFDVEIWFLKKNGLVGM